MRIVTRPDFDGIVCAVLIMEANHVTLPVKWISPSDMQQGKVKIFQGDIIANLPYHPNCSLWFDHHYSNRLRYTVKGAFSIAPSAAGLVFKYYRSRLPDKFAPLITETDKIDSADLSLDEIVHPEKYPYIMLSMTIQDHIPADEPYWCRVLDLLRRESISTILADAEVKRRCKKVLQENVQYQALLEKHTRLEKHVAISDFRSLARMPYGNRFLAYALFPEATVSVKIGFEDESQKTVVVKIGHSILNPKCWVNVGQMLSYFDGGGHKGAGSCKIPAAKADEYLPRIIDILKKNDPDGSIVVKVKRREVDRRSETDRRKAPPGSPAPEGWPEKRKGERRTGLEQRENWQPTGSWKSIKITL